MSVGVCVDPHTPTDRLEGPYAAAHGGTSAHVGATTWSNLALLLRFRLVCGVYHTLQLRVSARVFQGVGKTIHTLLEPRAKVFRVVNPTIAQLVGTFRAPRVKSATSVDDEA